MSIKKILDLKNRLNNAGCVQFLVKTEVEKNGLYFFLKICWRYRKCSLVLRAEILTIS